MLARLDLDSRHDCGPGIDHSACSYIDLIEMDGKLLAIVGHQVTKNNRTSICDCTISVLDQSWLSKPFTVQVHPLPDLQTASPERFYLNTDHNISPSSVSPIFLNLHSRVVKLQKGRNDIQLTSLDYGLKTFSIQDVVWRPEKWAGS